MTKISKILSHLKTKKSITPVDAYKLYGSMRLSSVIHTLRETYNIVTVDEDTNDRFGEPVRYAKYIYKGKVKGE
jgi:hypothetical protein